MRKLYFSKHPLTFVVVTLGLVFGLFGILTVVSNAKAKKGGPEVRIINDTETAINIYSGTEKRFIGYNIKPNEARVLGPFKTNIGSDGTWLRIDGKRWDRPVKVEFKGKELTRTKKLVEDRKTKFSGKVRTIKIDMSWPTFASHNGYDVELSQR